MRELEPGRDVRVVVELRRDDLVAGCPVRDAVRESAKLSDVMFAPNVTSSVITPSRSEAAARAEAITSSVTIEVRNFPPAFALAASR